VIRSPIHGGLAIFAAIPVARSESQLCEETLSNTPDQSQNDHLKTANLMRRWLGHDRRKVQQDYLVVPFPSIDQFAERTLQVIERFGVISRRSWLRR
jgi:hypothetical protein